MLFFIVTGLEFDLSTVAAVLMVAGYSINDTIVVFDRIRELLRKYRKMPLRELLNLAVKRNAVTHHPDRSDHTILALLALAIFGGAVIQKLHAGISGRYSSGFILRSTLPHRS